MAEYIEREAVLAEFSKCTIIPDDLYDYGIMAGIDAGKKKVKDAPAADVAPVPQEYIYFTTMDDENYLVDMTIPISKKQFDAINSGEDLWSVLRKGW